MITVSFGNQRNEPQRDYFSWGHITYYVESTLDLLTLSYTLHCKSKCQSWYVSEVKSLSCVRLFVTTWTVAYHIPPSMGFSRQEYWNGLPFPSPGDLPDSGIEPKYPALQADALLSEPPGKSMYKMEIIIVPSSSVVKRLKGVSKYIKHWKQDCHVPWPINTRGCYYLDGKTLLWLQSSPAVWISS